MNILIMNRKYDSVFGGVEFMSTALANEMQKRGHTCHLLSLDQKSEDKICYPLHHDIQWHRISDVCAKSKAGLNERLKRLIRVRGILKDQSIDIAIGFQDGPFLSLALSALGMRLPVIAAERNSPTRFDYLKCGKFRYIQFNLFRLAQIITVQSQSYIMKYPAYLRHKIKVIPNPVFYVNIDKIEQNRKSIGDHKIVSVGRLCYQKNQEVLVKAFAKLTEEFSDWTLVLVGDGENKEQLVKLIKDLNLENRVQLVGYQKNPELYLQQSDIFCLPSLWEGFPNALGEAMMYSISCVGFAQCAGISDLIDHGRTGFLADGKDDVDSLAESLKTLMVDRDLRTKLGQAARFEMLEQYAPDRMYDKWDNLFEKLCNSTLVPQ